MESSAQNSSGVHWWSGRLWYSTRFRRMFWRRSGRLWCRARSESINSGEGSGKDPGSLGVKLVRFNGVPEKVPKMVPENIPENVPGGLVQNQVQFNRVPEKKSGEGLGGFGVNLTRFRKRFRWRSGRLWCRARSGSIGFLRRSGRLWCSAKSGSTGFRKRFQEALVQSQVKIPEKV